MAATYRAVLFDLFGVIARVQSPAAQERIAALAGTQVPERVFWPAYWSCRAEYDRGGLLAAEYWHLVAVQLGSSFSPGQIQQLTEADLDSWSEIDSSMVEVLAALRERGERLGLLSNIPEELAARFLERFEWLAHFEVLGLSARIGSAKPDPAAYSWCLAELGTAPEHTLFIDDRQENINAALDLGIQGHLFTSVRNLKDLLHL